VVTGHVGNWELLGKLLTLLGYRLDAVARPIDNPLINRWLLEVRQRRGMRIITKWNATDTMVDVLQHVGARGFIADQNAGHKGLFVPYFGRLASTYKSIGLLALQQEVPIVCGYVHRLGLTGRYELGVTDVIEPTDWAEAEDPLYYVTARYMRAIELMVRRRPAQYLWMHRRWRSRPRFERLGGPMPVGLRRKIESLPWTRPGETEALAGGARYPA
jgi:KDO2-lipid IV(A) lauroyltransferase